MLLVLVVWHGGGKEKVVGVKIPHDHVHEYILVLLRKANLVIVLLLFFVSGKL